ncbi:flagellar protein FlaG [Halomonas sp. PA5]|nr:flagellar protein FlaG [Halomonas sp. PA5]
MINDLSDATRALTTQQRLDTMLAQLGTRQVATIETEAVRGAAAPTTVAELFEPLQRINEVMRSYGVEFDLNEFENRTVTRIIDRDTGETIRQIPSEEVLRIAESLSQLQGRLIQLEA